MTKRFKKFQHFQVWMLLLTFVGSLGLVTSHNHSHQKKEKAECATCHLQQELRTSKLAPTFKIRLPNLRVELLLLDLGSQDDLSSKLLTKYSQAPPVA